MRWAFFASYLIHEAFMPIYGSQKKIYIYIYIYIRKQKQMFCLEHFGIFHVGWLLFQTGTILQPFYSTIPLKSLFEFWLVWSRPLPISPVTFLHPGLQDMKLIGRQMACCSHWSNHIDWSNRGNVRFYPTYFSPFQVYNTNIHKH